MTDELKACPFCNSQAAEIERMKGIIEQIYELSPVYPNGKPRPLMVAIDIARTALEGREG